NYHTIQGVAADMDTAMQNSGTAIGMSQAGESLTFIGTSHGDPGGFDSLYARLRDIRPDAVLLEVSWFSLFFRKTAGAVLKRIFLRNIRSLGITMTPELHTIESFFDIPFEYRAVKQFCREEGVTYHLVDLPFISFLRLLKSHRLVYRKNLLLLSGFTGNRAQQEMSLAKRLFAEQDDCTVDIILSRISKDRLGVKRERKLAEKIIRYRKKYIGRSIAYIGGWEHLLEDPKQRTLYSMVPMRKQRTLAFVSPPEKK
nr:hypothetical protein [Spirochaetota bacterium]